MTKKVAALEKLQGHQKKCHKLILLLLGVVKHLDFLCCQSAVVAAEVVELASEEAVSPAVFLIGTNITVVYF